MCRLPEGFMMDSLVPPTWGCIDWQMIDHNELPLPAPTPAEKEKEEKTMTADQDQDDQQPDPYAADWVCAHCGQGNPPTMTTCQNCGEPRP